MTKIWLEICLISARGLTRTLSLWKLQWFAVGWIDPNNKYCTKVDASGNSNPTWKTKFSASTDSRCDDLTLNVEVYSRDPVFLKERLQGTASIGLKEFLDKHRKNCDDQSLKHVEEVGSFQLRKKSSNKPQGFVDVSFRISPETNEGSSYEGDDVGIKLRIRNHEGIHRPSPIGNSENHLQTDYYSAGGGQNYPSSGGPGYQPPHTPSPAGSSYHHPRTQPPLTYPCAGGSNHQPPPPPPPPPYNVGYMPSSSMDNYMNMPSSSSSSRPGARPGLAMGLGAGALAAGAVIFGDDFVSGFDVPTGFTISTDPPF
ncbi:actin cytoskeleton-regulatory complex protein pan1 [Cynara cardunculus var. scolymus]|uniref:actin cytoskeleton-regulatory complex protein pan1 n=1 Tax=Cynara cardunculus var. scolymus TaxID=59895 RepID=UPI000D62315A|nr:actin cytoskeleton-regulatory complex protein pan1 [Cynara cardunculus var. scolymus]